MSPTFMSVVPVASHSVGTAKARMRLMRRERFSSDRQCDKAAEAASVQGRKLADDPSNGYTTSA